MPPSGPTGNYSSRSLQKGLGGVPSPHVNLVEASLDPSWYGHSIGRWEGDTLVVDTVGFNDRFWFDFKGHPHTDKLHTIERYTRTNQGTLVVQTTVDDLGAYTRPFTVTFTARLRPGEELMEYCNENNQDVEHITGPASEFN